MGARTRTHDPREVARLGFAAFDVPELLRAEEVREAEADPGEPDEVLLGVDDVEDEPAEDVEALAVDDALVRRELDAAGPLLAGNDERGDRGRGAEDHGQVVVVLAARATVEAAPDAPRRRQRGAAVEGHIDCLTAAEDWPTFQVEMAS